MHRRPFRPKINAFCFPGANRSLLKFIESPSKFTFSSIKFFPVQRKKGNFALSVRFSLSPLVTGIRIAEFASRRISKPTRPRYRFNFINSIVGAFAGNWGLKFSVFFFAAEKLKINKILRKKSHRSNELLTKKNAKPFITFFP